MINNLTQLHLK